jgi:PAS domain S-box-containing protein
MTESDPVLDVPILVVDDRAENRTALRSLLEMPGYRIVEAPSGAEALRVLMDREVAVLLLDVVMPQMDGFEVARMIKERDRTASVPIIFLTAQPDDAFLSAKGWEVGAVDFLSKPLVPEAVQSKVAVFAQLYRQRKEIERQAKRIVDAERREGDMRMMQLELAGERRWRSLAEAVPAILWTAYADGRIVYMNHRWFEHTGISAERAAGSFVSAIHPDDVEHCKNVWSSAREKGEPLETEVRLLRASDRTYRWHICRAVPQLGATGQIVSWLGTFVDIDDQKRGGDAAREHHRTEAQPARARAPLSRGSRCDPHARRVRVRRIARASYAAFGVEAAARRAFASVEEARRSPAHLRTGARQDRERRAAGRPHDPARLRASRRLEDDGGRPAPRARGRRFDLGRS